MNAVIISIGSELTGGQVVDTNTAWLSLRLAELGITVGRHETIPDDESAIAQVIRAAARDARVVLITGGLGPTQDDRTRHALAAAMNARLVENPDSWRRIQDYFTQRSYNLTPANRRQALVPTGANMIPNACGTAPGLSAELTGACIYCMPGVPAEMKAMYMASVEPELRNVSSGRVSLTRTLLTFGEGEAAVGELIADLMAPGRNPQVGTLASEAVIGIRVTANGDAHQEARALLERDVNEIRRRLGDLVFGRDSETLADAAGRLLTQHRKTIAVAESCTGGLLAKMLTDVPGSSEYFLEGVVTYSNAAKVRLLDVPSALIERFGAVSAQVAESMALGCRRSSRAHYTLSITGIAGPSGGSVQKPVGLVYVALADEGGADVRELRLGTQLNREQIRVRACRSVLNLIRRRLLPANQ